MKKIIILSLFLFVLLTGIVAAEECDLSISLVNQDPYPAVPNSYVKVVFQVSGLENPECLGAKFELVETYPFSLDNKEGLRIVEGSTYISKYKTEWMIPYKIRVDNNALDGENEIKIRYIAGNTEKWVSSDNWISESFDIEIDNSRTDFDVIVQEVSDSEVAIAIANTGKNVAESVIVKIPEQENFKVTGTDGQMVGNLENGDYTLVTFEVEKNRGADSNELELQIFYTDTISERRTVVKTVDLNLGATSPLESLVSGTNRGSFQQTSTTSQVISILQSYWWAVLIVLIVAGALVYRKHRQKKKQKKVGITEEDRKKIKKKM